MTKTGLKSNLEKMGMILVEDADVLRGMDLCLIDGIIIALPDQIKSPDAGLSREKWLGTMFRNVSSHLHFPQRVFSFLKSVCPCYTDVCLGNF